VPLHKYGWQIGYNEPHHVNATFGADYEAQNNSYNVPPFWIYNAMINLPVSSSSWVHFAWQNIFNKNALIFSCFNCGVPYNGYAAPHPTTAYSTSAHLVTSTTTTAGAR